MPIAEPPWPSAVALIGCAACSCFVSGLPAESLGELDAFRVPKSVVYDRVVDHLRDAGIHTGLPSIAFNKSFDLRFATHGSDVEIRKHADELLAGGVMGVL